ncbi:MAG: DUF3192 domain-containing protein [Candidatus Omnitrophica bacterium]|nr:DUF3192 domain-containing protein [Candidatus Omnitrophota bacterium]
MRKILSIIALVIFIAGCATALYKSSSSNKKNLGSLVMGMTKEEVMDTMGRGSIITESMSVTNPYMIKRMVIGSRHFEVLYYVTDALIEDQFVDDDELTPIIFENGALIGWGWGYIQKLSG